MKTVNTPRKIASTDSSATDLANLKNHTAIAILEVRGELVPRTARHFNRHQRLKRLVLSLSLGLGTFGLILSPFVTSAVVHQKAKTPTKTNLVLKATPTTSTATANTAKAPDDFVYPLVSYAPLTSPFGWRVHPISGQRRLHGGVDFEAPHGAPIVAAITGKVVMADWNGGHGKTVVIERDNNFQTLYAHMSKILVKKDQLVRQGEVIGYVGSTGRSTGAHLHFETLIPGKDKDTWVAVDPAVKVQYAISNFRRSTQVSQGSTVSNFN